MRIQSIGDYYTLQGAAEALGVSYWQVWRAVRQQQTPTLLLGQTRLVLLEDVQAAMPECASDQGEREWPNPERPSALGRRPADARDQHEHENHSQPAAPEPQRPTSPSASAWRVLGQLCPQCESRALVYEEGCRKCYACGYAAC